MLAVIKPNFEESVGLLVYNRSLSGNQIILCQYNLLWNQSSLIFHILINSTVAVPPVRTQIFRYR